MLDLIIIGAGAAGLTAAIYGCRAGLSLVVLEKMGFGGQIALTDAIDNYPGLASVTGWELSEKIYQQAADLGADIRFEQVERMELTGPVKRVVTDGGTYEAPTLILASGVVRRKLGVPGEEEHVGRGVSYCATCDGAFYRGQTVAVVGGGNTALEEALYLSPLCETVYLVHRRGEYRAEQALVQAIAQRDNIKPVLNTLVTAVEGEPTVSALRITTQGQPGVLNVSGVFAAIGTEPETSLFAGQLPLDASGYIQAGEDCVTAVPGVFAAGDCRTKPLRQIVTATADGANAATSAIHYLQQQNKRN